MTLQARIAQLVVAGLISFAGSAAVEAADRLDKGKSVSVLSAQIGFNRDEPGKRRFGKLDWIGTLRLSSVDGNFGGFSGLAIGTNGENIFSVTDRGYWLRARISYSDGRPERIIGAKMGKLAGRGGRTLDGKTETDAEGLAMEELGALTGTFYVAFERKHRIAAHRVTKDAVGPARRLLKLPKGARSAKRNKGIEGITRLHGGPSKGALLAFTEDHLDKDGNHIGWLIGGRKPGMVTLRKRDGFSVTDLTSLPSGDVFVLERRFRYSEGVKMRIRRIRAAAVSVGARLDGEILFRANQLFEIDNMEGIASHTGPTGRTILTLISDDNFNRVLQRTLLMQFAVVE